MEELIELINGVIEFYNNHSTGINTLVGIISIIVAIILYVIPQLKKKEEAKEQKKQQLDTNFKDYLNSIYIPMNVKDVQSGGKVFPFFEHFAEIIQKRPIKSRYICLLGDIGSGKTATMARLHQWYINEHSAESSMPTDIRLYTLNKGYQKLIARIDAEIPQKDRSNCILLLDALDECEEARASLENTPENNPRKFMEQLGKDTEGFAWVVVSCRRQFFQNEEFQPGKAKVPVGEKGFGSLPYWQELVLEPFNHAQVESFIVKHFEVGENPLKNEAIKMVYDCKDVFLRPLILSNIDVILKECHGRENLTMKVILDAVIMNWIRREAMGDEAKAKELLNASLCAAAYMYKHKLIYLNDANYKAMCKEHGIDDQGNLLRVQSLLTNDAKEGFRFAHQSFYEHFLAYWFFMNPWDIGSMLGLLESTLPAYVEIQNEDKEKPTEMSRLLGVERVDNKTKARGLHNIGYGLYNLCYFSDAEPFYNDALEINRTLENNQPGEFIADIATTLNNLAILHYRTNRHAEAEKEYGEALKTNRELADQNPDAYMPDVAMTLNNLAILHSDTNHYDEADKEYDEALRIYRELADKNPDTYMPYVAQTLNNHSALHYSTNRYDEAEKEYGEALEKYRELAKKNPDAYMPCVAGTLNNLGALHYRTKRHAEAEKEYGEALEKYRELAEKNPDAYMPYVAQTLINLGALHNDTNHYDEAEKEYGETLEIYRELADKNPDAYMPYVAQMLNNHGTLHYSANRYDEAEKEYGEAQKIRRALAERNPDAYLPHVAETLFNMALLHAAKGELAEAEEKAKEGLELYQRMAELSHAAFDKYVEMAKNVLARIQAARG